MSVPYGQPPAAPQPGSPKSPLGDLGLGKLLALATGGFGLIIYFLTFADDAGSYLRTSLLGVLLVGGGLLAAAAVLPKAPATLVPAAVLIVTGTLFLLIDVTKGPITLSQGGDLTTPGLIIVALVLAFMESVACCMALLTEAGLVKLKARPKPSPFPQQSWPQQPGGYYGGPVQGGYPGQPQPGSPFGGPTGPGGPAGPGGPGGPAGPGAPGGPAGPGGPGGPGGGYPQQAPPQQPQQGQSQAPSQQQAQQQQYSGPPTVQYYPQQAGQSEPGSQQGQSGQQFEAGQQHDAGQQYRTPGTPPAEYGPPGQS